MKTLKRIALLLKLKWEESKYILVCIIAMGMVVYFVLLLLYFPIFEKIIFWLFIIVLSYIWSVIFVKWIYSNWQEVKRRIP